MAKQSRIAKPRRKPVAPAARAPARQAAGGVKLVDVASAVGVSINTVSRALRAPQTVRPALRSRIEREIERSGYVPNCLAGGLAGAQTGVVGVIITSLFYSEFAETIDQLQQGLAAAGLHVMIGNTRYDPEVERDLVRAMLSWRPAAIAIVGTDHDPRTTELLRASRVPVVEIWDAGHDPIDSSVGMDHHAVGALQAEHLVAAGYRRLAFAGAVREHDHRAAKRLAGACDATRRLLKRDIAIEIERASGNPDLGEALIGRLVARCPDIDGVVCNSDVIAFGALRGLARLGRRVPEDIGVIGFGDNEAGACLTPPLTSVKPPRGEVGRRAADAILARIAGAPPRRRVLGVEIVARGSTRAPAPPGERKPAA